MWSKFLNRPGIRNVSVSKPQRVSPCKKKDSSIGTLDRRDPVSRDHPGREAIANLYSDGRTLRVVDLGDSSIAHPFFSLLETFRFLNKVNHLHPDDPWFRRLRDAYLEPWGSGLEEIFDRAIRIGWFAHAIAWTRQRGALPPAARPDFDRGFRIILRRAVAQTSEGRF